MRRRDLKVSFAATVAAALILASSPEASETVENHRDRAQEAYEAGSHLAAEAWLVATPGLLSVIPSASSISGSERAEILLDIAVCRLAADDTSRARLAVEQAYSIDPGRKVGRLSHPTLDPFRRNVVHNLRASSSGRTRWGAFKRSLILPGWGQVYHGHRKKGLALMGLGLGATALWAVKYNSFRSARSTYEATTRQDVVGGTLYENDDGTHYTEYEARHRVAQSRASTANKLLGAALAIWGFNILDSIVAGPGYIGITFSVP